MKISTAEIYALNIRTAPDGKVCIENDYYEPHKRGRNWVATVNFNPANHYKLDRVFWLRGAEHFFVAPGPITVGDVLEFGGDYISCRGIRYSDRVYRLVLAVHPTDIEVADVSKPGAKNTDSRGRLIFVIAEEPVASSPVILPDSSPTVARSTTGGLDR